MKARPHYAGLRVVLAIVLSLLAIGSAGCNIVMAPTPEPLVLRVAYRPGEVDLGPLLEAYQRDNPGITVEALELSRSGSSELSAALREETVDIIRDSRDVLDNASQGLLLPLQDLVEADPEWVKIRDDYYKGSWEGLTIQGQQWGIPAGLDTFVMYLNMDAVDTLGLTVPDANWTMDDLLAMANNLNYPDGIPGQEDSQVLFGLCTAQDDFDPVIFTYLHGGRIVDDVNSPTQATLDDPLTIEAVQWYADLFGLYNVAPKSALISTYFYRGGMTEAEESGACGLWMGWYSERGGTDPTNPWKMQWHMLPLPVDRVALNLGDLDGYYIAKSCAYPQEALNLVRYLSDHWEAAGNQLPPRSSLVQDADYARSVGQDVATVAASFSNQIVVLPVEAGPVLYSVGEAFLTAVNQVIEGDVSADEALARAQARVQNVFQTQ